MKPLLEFFGHKSIRSIKQSDIKTYKAQRLNAPVVFEINRKVLNEEGSRKKYRIEKVKRETPRKIATVNRELALLRQIFNFAKGDEHLTKTPFDGAKLISTKAENQRDRVLSHEEEKRLLAACVKERAHLRPLVVIAVDTAMRRGELLTLVWRDVDLVSGVITVRATNTKTLESRQIGITSRMRDELKALWNMSPKVPDTSVFGMQSFKKAWETACGKAEIEGLTFHSLRHTGITRMVRAGIPHAEIMNTSGHSQMKTFMRYTNQTSESVNAQARALDAYISRRQSEIEKVESAFVN